MAIGAITVHGRSAGSLSKRRFANVLKRWPLGGANEGNITPGDGVQFDAGMFGVRDNTGVLQLAVGAANEQPLFILDDFDSYDVVEAGQVPYMPRANYTVETSAIDPGLTVNACPPGTLMIVGSAVLAGLLIVPVAPPVAGIVQWIVEEARSEVLPSGASVVVVRVTPVV
jgi:hypothetical protein